MAKKENIIDNENKEVKEIVEVKAYAPKEYADEELKDINVYGKLQLARAELTFYQFNKSGKNKFAGYNYFELKDFLPTATKVFAKYHLTPLFNLALDVATLKIVDWDNKEDNCVVFTTPTADNAVKGCTPVQNLGSVHTYLRRYLYLNALDLVEDDTADALTKSNLNEDVNKPTFNVRPNAISTAPTPQPLSTTPIPTPQVSQSQPITTAPSPQTQPVVEPVIEQPSPVVENSDTTPSPEDTVKYINEIRSAVTTIKEDRRKELYAFIKSQGLPLSLIGITEIQYKAIVGKINELKA